MLQKRPLIFGIDPGLRKVITISSSLHLLLKHSQLHQKCQKFAYDSISSRAMKYSQFRMRGYSALY